VDTGGCRGPARQVAIDLGKQRVERNEKETRVWRDASQAIYDSWIGRYGQPRARRPSADRRSARELMGRLR